MKTRKSKLVLMGGTAAVLGQLLSGCGFVHDAKVSGPIQRATSANVLSQIAYAKAHYRNPNRSHYGDLGGTDCVNFTSQTLIARGWKMDTDWSFSIDALGTHYSRPWISSTGLHDYLLQHPERATALSWSQRDRVAIGDIVQFDWDNSGDRDHTAVVSGIATIDGKRELLLTSHSPAAFDWPIDEVIAEHGDPTKVYFWHLR